MALPFTENFTNTDFVKLATHNAGWVNVGGGVPEVDIYTNAARLDTSAYSVVGAKWTTDTFNADQSSQATILTTTGAGSIVSGVFIRGSGSGATFAGYVAWVYNSDSKLYVYKFDGIDSSGVGTVNISGALNTIVANDVIKLWAVGSAIHASVNGVECTGSPWTNTAISAAGAPGFIVANWAVPMLDAWVGDNVGGGGGGPVIPVFMNQYRQRG